MASRSIARPRLSAPKSPDSRTSGIDSRIGAGSRTAAPSSAREVRGIAGFLGRELTEAVTPTWCVVGQPGVNGRSAYACLDDRPLRPARAARALRRAATSWSSGCGSSCWRSRRCTRPGSSRPTTGSGSVPRWPTGEVDAERAREIEQESQHDVIAFLRSVTERLGPEGRWLHYGLTSSDVLDTATAVVLRDATAVVEGSWRGWRTIVRADGARASVHRRWSAAATASTPSRSPSASRRPAGSRRCSATRSGCSGPGRGSRSARSPARWAPMPTSAPRSSVRLRGRWDWPSTRPRPRWSAATATPSC